MDFNFWSTDNSPGSGVLAPTSEPNTYMPAGYGVLAPQSGPSYLDFTSMWGQPNIKTDGVNLIDQRANTGFSIFDQSKVSASIFDIMNSGVQAAGKVGVQLASDSINRQSNQSGLLGMFARNFRSTQTGQQINAAAYGTIFLNFLSNPMVWFAAIAGIGLLLVLKFKG